MYFLTFMTFFVIFFNDSTTGHYPFLSLSTVLSNKYLFICTIYYELIFLFFNRILFSF